MLGSRAMLAVDGDGAAAATTAGAAAAAVRAGRAGAGLAREAAAELRLHGFIDLSVSFVVSLVVPLVVLVFLFVLVLSASAFHFGALPFLKALAASVLLLSCSTRASILVLEFSSHFAFMRKGRA